MKYHFYYCYDVSPTFLSATVKKLKLLSIEEEVLSILQSLAYLSSYHEKAIRAPKRARLGVAGHLSTPLKWRNPAMCLSQRHNK